ncbi:hypothetical protein QO034_05600 [Sedimentitalea sp. JM2-8]|uniref:Uncharacterized protein n=1 Tax=Sedimentitalea xiamensis TaxID=3050037 RepID=A0ABT7FBT2_9RHOB|nr:hypothetical protein [Sedimentitalea xiamensis]MDK3072577.1 hypothetical protein [Sedimentitalea xiamensis]
MSDLLSGGVRLAGNAPKADAPDRAGFGARGRFDTPAGTGRPASPGVPTTIGISIE